MSRSSWASATVSDRSVTSIKRWMRSRSGSGSGGSTGYSIATFNPFSTRLTRITSVGIRGTESYLRLSPSFGGHNHDRYQQGHHRDDRRRSWQEYLSYLRYERQRNNPSARKIDARRAAETLGKYSALPHRHGGLRRIPSHWPPAYRTRPRRSLDASEIRQAVSEEPQERLSRCRGDCRGGAAPNHALCALQERRATRSSSAPPRPKPT